MNCIFIDVDGTLTTPSGEVPESAQKAIQQARHNGHKVFLSTGRSKSEITDDILKIGFDGIIGAGGSYIEINNQVIEHTKMTTKEVERITSFLDDLKVGYYLESNQGLFANQYCEQSILKVVEASESKYLAPQWFFEILRQFEKVIIPYDDINKVSFISVDTAFDVIKNELENDFIVHHGTVAEFGKNSGEIGVYGIDKEVAIKKVLDYLDLPFTKTYAYGDGLNDIAMFNIVDHGVAMENAFDQLKQVANEVTSKAQDDGLYLSFKKNQLI